MISSQVQYYVIQYKPKAATWDYKEISGAITNFYDIRGLRWVEVDILRGNNIDSGQLQNFCLNSLQKKESINDSQFQIFSTKSLNNYPRIKSYWLV